MIVDFFKRFIVRLRNETPQQRRMTFAVILGQFGSFWVGAYYFSIIWVSLVFGRLPDESQDGTYFWTWADSNGDPWYTYVDTHNPDILGGLLAILAFSGGIVFWSGRRGLVKKYLQGDRRGNSRHISLLIARVLHGNRYVEEVGREIVAHNGETGSVLFSLWFSAALLWRWDQLRDWWLYSRNLEKSWYAVLANQPVLALQASLEAIEARPGSLLARSNLPHALMLMGENDAAWTMYFEHEGKRVCPCGQCKESWDETMLLDLMRMHKAGIATPMMAEVAERLLGEDTSNGTAR